MKDSKIPIGMTVVEKESGMVKLKTSVEIKNNNNKDDEIENEIFSYAGDENVYDIVTMTASAPFAFESYEDYVDGGVGANNPSFYAYKYGRAMFPNSNLVIVFIGTGTENKS